MTKSLYILAFLFTLGPAAKAQDPTGRTELAPPTLRSIEADCSSFLRAEVDGDFEGAIHRLTEAISQAPEGREAQRLRARLVCVLERLGRNEETKPLLVAMAGGIAPYSQWASDRAAKLPSAQDVDPLQDLIARLNETDYSRYFEAYQQLEVLGQIVVPALRRGIWRLGPAGAERACKLLTKSADEEVYSLFEAMLDATADREYFALVAARTMGLLPEVGARRLAERAIKSRLDSIRMEGWATLAQFDDRRDEARRNVIAALSEPDKGVHRRALEVLCGKELASGRDVDAILEAYARRKDSNLAALAAVHWLNRRSVDDEPRAKSFLDSIEDPEVRSTLIGKVLEDQPSWLDLGLEGLAYPRTFTTVLDKFASRYFSKPSVGGVSARQIMAIAALPARMVEGLDSNKAEAVAAFLDTCGEPGAGAVAELWLKSRHTSLRRAGLRYLVRVTPDAVAGRLEELLSDPSLADIVIPLAIERGSAACVPAAAALVRTAMSNDRRDENYRPRQFGALDVIVRHADATSVPCVIDLLRRPVNWPNVTLMHEFFGKIETTIGRIVGREDAARFLEAAPSIDDDAWYRACHDRLVALADATTVAAVMKATRNVNSEQVAATCIAMLEKAGSAAVEALTTLALDEKSPVCGKALVVLSRIDEAKAVEVILASASRPGLLTESVLETSASLQPEARAQILGQVVKSGFLADSGDDLAAWLFKLPVSDMTSVMSDVVAAGDFSGIGNMEVKSLLIAVSRLKNKDAIDFAARFIDHRSVGCRTVAAETIAAICMVEGAPILIEALKDRDEDVRAAARTGLAKLEEYLAAKEKWDGILKK